MMPRSLAALLTSVLTAWAWLAPVPARPLAAAPVPPDPLRQAAEASREAAAKLQSAAGSATFEVSHQGPGDAEPLITRGRVQVYYDRGKYHLRFQYDSMMARVTDLDRDGKKVRERISRWKPDDRAVLYDGAKAQSVTFSKLFRPSGCLVEVYPSLRDVPMEAPRDPAHLWREIGNVAELVKSPHVEGLQVSSLSGATRFTCRLKGAPQVSRVEYEVGPASGYNPTRMRVLPTGRDEPFQDYQVEWAKARGAWYARRLVKKHAIVSKDGVIRDRLDFRYDSFDVNTKVEPKLFTPDCLSIPAKARTLDRRPGHRPMAGPPAGR